VTGIERIAAERKRQVEVEGWMPEHDKQHKNSELATGNSISPYFSGWCFFIGLSHDRHP
jgi:hypothetical protein